MAEYMIINKWNNPIRKLRFKYLRRVLTGDTKFDNGIQWRIGIVKIAFQKRSQVLRNRKISELLQNISRPIYQ